MKVEGNKFDYHILKRLLGFIKPYRFQFFILVFIIISTAVLAPLTPYIISLTINEELINFNYDGLFRNILLLLAILSSQIVLTFLNTYLSGWLGQSVIRDIRIQLYKHVLTLKLKFFDTTPIGRLVTRNISDIEALAEVFSQGLAAVAAEILQLLFILGFMFWHNWRLTLVSLAMLPVLIISTYVFKEKIKSSYDAVRTAIAHLNTFVQEHVTGMSIVQIFNTEEREYAKFEKINNEHRAAHLRSVKYYSVYFPVAEVISAIGVGLLLWFGARGLVIGTVSNIGDLIAFIMYLNMFFRPIRLIADRFNTIQMGLLSTARIVTLLDNNDVIADNGQLADVDIKGKIEFDNVHFSYVSETPVLKQLSFSVNEGESVAFVGATGAGKSSVISLINRLYEIDEGEIRIDDHNIKAYTLHCLRNKIGIVLQEVFLFSGSIRENICLGNKNITDQQIWEAVRLVGAKEFIDKLPGKLGYNVQERGVSLSVGQRQLISFIRAMVFDPKILILDEATSSVDSETEKLIQNAIAKMMKGRTSVIVAHRLSTIQHVDQIIVMEKGEIKEQGTHTELLKNEGDYYKLYHLQYKLGST